MTFSRLALLLAALAVTPTMANAAPEISVDLTSTTLSVDADGDGRADAGDQIHFQGSVANTGDSSTSVTITIPADPNLTAGPSSLSSNPIAIDDIVETDEDTPVTVAAPGVTANDIDYPLPTALTVIDTTSTAVQGQVAINATGEITFDPDGAFETLAEGQASTQTLQYAVSDAQDNIDTATVTIVVSGVNDAPVVAAQSVTTDEDTPLEITLTGTDVDDGAALVFSVVSAPAKGSLGAITPVSDTSAKVTFTPGEVFQSLAQGQSDTVSFTYTATDGTASAAAATIQVTITGVNDAPVPATENYNATGNTTFEAGGTAGNSGAFIYTRNGTGNLLLNDTDVDAGATLQAVAETVTSTGGGSVTIRADGSFFYVPPAGFTGGNDTFTYKVTDSIATVSQSVTVAVAGKLWYINNGATGSSNGTSQNPFTTLASFNTANTGAAGKPQNNDFIYLVGTATSYTGGITLRDGQILQGSGVALSRDGVVQPAGSTPIIGNSAGAGITLGSGNTVTALNIAGTSGFAISGSAVGTLNLSNLAINNAGTNGGALNLTGGTVNVALADVVTGTAATNAIALSNINGSVSATGGSLANATQETVLIAAGTANITWPGTITNSSAKSVVITNKTNGTVVFGGSITDNGTGIVLSSNTGATVRFTGGLDLSTGSNVAFNATGGGTISITGAPNTINAGTATALNVLDTTIGTDGLTFRSVSSSGGANGIVLRNTGSGSLTVTGGGASSTTNMTRGRTTVGASGTLVLGSGGTIQGHTENGISLTNAGPVTLRNMTVQNGTSGVNNTRAGVLAAGVAGLTLDNLRVTGFPNISGLRASNVAGLNVIHSEFVSNATSDGVLGQHPSIDSVDLTNVTGTVSVQSSLFNLARRNLIEINQTAGEQFLLVTNCNILACTGGTGLSVVADGTAIADSNIQNNTFTTGNSSWGLNLTTQNMSAANMNNMVTGNIFSNQYLGVNIASGTSGLHDYVISNNNFQNHLGLPININRLGVAPPASFPFGTFSGVIQSNTIGTAGVPNSGSPLGVNGIDVKTNGNNGIIRVSIIGNTIRNVGDYGIRLLPRDATIGHTLHAKIHGNSIAEISPMGLSGIAVIMGALNTDKLNVCLDIFNNIVINAPQNAIRVRSSGLPAADVDLGLKDWDGVMAVATYLANRNIAATGASGNISFNNPTGTNFPANCTTP